ncbi:hypothetical protein GDO81_007030 [Engystomops pustulosus]|uniref:Ig-like domain-containing protein n=1 Tax=Engystomops pustulosus TaxID=76066 RepID=A0AAV7D2R4_ENGPU|nr:hypothetical protein GDO81_007030 [Engystomops pustulosus]
MDGYRTLLIWSIILCLTQDYGSCANILDGPQNVTVLTGSNATFLCTVASGWRSISWYLKNVFIVTITPSETTVSPGYTIVTQNSTNSITGAFTTEITIVNVNKSNSGTVQCSSFSASFQEAYLSVQVKGSVQITGGNVIVTPNSTVSLTCRAEQWYPAPSITWQINNTLADTIYYSTSYTTDANDFVTALSSFRINPETDLSLTCLATVQTLPQPQSSTVNITVREQSPGGKGKERAAIRVMRGKPQRSLTTMYGPSIETVWDIVTSRTLPSQNQKGKVMATMMATPLTLDLPQQAPVYRFLEIDG